MVTIASSSSPRSTAAPPPGRCSPGRSPRSPGAGWRAEPARFSRTPAPRLWLSPGPSSMMRLVSPLSTGSPCSSPTPPLPGETAVDPLQFLQRTEPDLQLALLVSIVDLHRGPEPLAKPFLQLDDLHRAKRPNPARPGLERLAGSSCFLHLTDTPPLGDGSLRQMGGEGDVLHPNQRSHVTCRQL